MTQKEFYTVAEIAAILGVQPHSLRYYIDTLKTLVPCGKAGYKGLALKFEASHVDAFVRAYIDPESITVGEAADCIMARYPLRQRTKTQWTRWLKNRVQVGKLPKPAPTAEFWNCVQSELDKEGYLFPEERS